jgi:tRNA U34 5-carboxymethylaminomethyl modifying GTPase MnmE/TrmE
MQIESEKDFPALRNQIKKWRTQFSMFSHDVDHLENSIEHHIKNYSNAMVYYRQTRKSNYLDQANEEIQSINRLVDITSKMGLLAILSQ